MRNPQYTFANAPPPPPPRTRRHIPIDSPEHPSNEIPKVPVEFEPDYELVPVPTDEYMVEELQKVGDLLHSIKVILIWVSIIAFFDLLPEAAKMLKAGVRAVANWLVGT